MTDVLEATGKVTGIEERAAGFRRITVDVGRQYPLRVDTKLDTVIDQAREALDWPAALVRYTESESQNENPKTGKPYTNRYATEFLPVTPADLAKAQEKQGDNGGQYWKPRDPGERLSIERQSALRTAFEFGAYRLGTLKTAEERAELELYLFGLATRLEAHVVRPAEGDESAPEDGPPPLTDADAPVIDDVPFV